MAELYLRVELRTSSLPRKCSTTELIQHRHLLWSGKRGSNPRPPAWKASALSTELFPQKNIAKTSLHCFSLIGNITRISVSAINRFVWWVVMDSNHRSRKTADLQSAPFGHSGNYPIIMRPFALSFIRLSATPPQRRASCRIRTNDPEITNHVLWPTELKRHAFLHPSDVAWDIISISVAKVRIISETAKLFAIFFSIFLIFPSFSSVSPSRHRHRGLFPPQTCRTFSQRTESPQVRPQRCSSSC